MSQGSSKSVSIDGDLSDDGASIFSDDRVSDFDADPDILSEETFEDLMPPRSARTDSAKNDPISQTSSAASSAKPIDSEAVSDDQKSVTVSDPYSLESEGSSDDLFKSYGASDKDDPLDSEDDSVSILSSHSGDVSLTDRNTAVNRNPPPLTPSQQQMIAKGQLTETQAATKIQSSFRGHQVRKKVRFQDRAAATIQTTYRKHLRRLTGKKQKPQGKEPHVASPKDKVAEEAAATRIQARYRGHKARAKHIASMQQSKREPSPQENELQIAADEAAAELLGIESQAATAIQANYRGHLVRKEISERKRLLLLQDEKDAHDAAVRLVYHGDEEKAAVRIQSTFRGHQARKSVKFSRTETDEIAKQNEAAVKIQSRFRGHATRKSLKSQSLHDPVKDDTQVSDSEESRQAAVKIQSRFRGHMARKQLKRSGTPIPEEFKYDSDQEKAAVKIQSRFRGHAARKQLKRSGTPVPDEFKYDSDQEKAAVMIQSRFRRKQAKPSGTPTPADMAESANDSGELEKAAVKIQSQYRGHRTRKQIRRSLTPRPFDDVGDDILGRTTFNSDEEQAAIRMQATFRGHLARKSLHGSNTQKPDTPRALPMADDVAAVKIQSRFRGFQARKGLDARGMRFGRQKELDILQPIAEEESAATKIQAQFRGRIARKEATNRRLLKVQEQENSAAAHIQATYRGHQARKQYQAHRASKLREETEERAAVTIQSSFKGHQDRKRVAMMKKEQTDATVRIQAGFRGYKARKEFRERKSTYRLDAEKLPEEDLSPEVLAIIKEEEERERRERARLLEGLDMLERIENEKKVEDEHVLSHHWQIREYGLSPQEQFTRKLCATKIQRGYRSYRSLRGLKDEAKDSVLRRRKRASDLGPDAVARHQEKSQIRREAAQNTPQKASFTSRGERSPVGNPLPAVADANPKERVVRGRGVTAIGLSRGPAGGAGDGVARVAAIQESAGLGDEETDDGCTDVGSGTVGVDGRAGGGSGASGGGSVGSGSAAAGADDSAVRGGSGSTEGVGAGVGGAGLGTGTHEALRDDAKSEKDGESNQGAAAVPGARQAQMQVTTSHGNDNSRAVSSTTVDVDGIADTRAPVNVDAWRDGMLSELDDIVREFGSQSAIAEVNPPPTVGAARSAAVAVGNAPPSLLQAAASSWASAAEGASQADSGEVVSGGASAGAAEDGGRDASVGDAEASEVERIRLRLAELRERRKQLVNKRQHLENVQREKETRLLAQVKARREEVLKQRQEIASQFEENLKEIQIQVQSAEDEAIRRGLQQRVASLTQHRREQEARLARILDQLNEEEASFEKMVIQQHAVCEEAHRILDEEAQELAKALAAASEASAAKTSATEAKLAREEAERAVTAAHTSQVMATLSSAEDGNSQPRHPEDGASSAHPTGSEEYKHVHRPAPLNSGPAGKPTSAWGESRHAGGGGGQGEVQHEDNATEPVVVDDVPGTDSVADADAGTGAGAGAGAGAGGATAAAATTTAATATAAAAAGAGGRHETGVLRDHEEYARPKQAGVEEMLRQQAHAPSRPMSLDDWLDAEADLTDFDRCDWQAGYETLYAGKIVADDEETMTPAFSGRVWETWCNKLVQEIGEDQLEKRLHSCILPVIKVIHAESHPLDRKYRGNLSPRRSTQVPSKKHIPSRGAGKKDAKISFGGWLGKSTPGGGVHPDTSDYTGSIPPIMMHTHPRPSTAATPSPRQDKRRPPSTRVSIGASGSSSSKRPGVPQEDVLVPNYLPQDTRASTGHRLLRPQPPGTVKGRVVTKGAGKRRVVKKS